VIGKGSASFAAVGFEAGAGGVALDMATGRTRLVIALTNMMNDIFIIETILAFAGASSTPENINLMRSTPVLIMRVGCADPRAARYARS
jgi:hypothetical protein